VGLEESEDALPPPLPPKPETPATDGIKDYSDKDLQAMESEDPLSLIDSLSTRVGTPVTSGVSTSVFRIAHVIRSFASTYITSNSLQHRRVRPGRLATSLRRV
jgi:hypothetical protein